MALLLPRRLCLLWPLQQQRQRPAEPFLPALAHASFVIDRRCNCNGHPDDVPTPIATKSPAEVETYIKGLQPLA